MAVLTMANDNKDGEKKTPFHDFLGKQQQQQQEEASGFSGESRSPSEASASVGASSIGPHGPLSSTSDLGSERQMENHFEGVPVHGLRGDLNGVLVQGLRGDLKGVPVHGLRSDLSGPEISTISVGRKRGNSDTLFMGLPRERMLPTGQESHGNSHLMKMLRGNAGGEMPRRSQDEGLFFGMQPPRQPSSSQLMLQPPVGSRPDTSKWEQSVRLNASPSMQFPPHMGPFPSYHDQISLNKYRDINAGPSAISQPAADESSRTGIRGAGILSGMNVSSGASERNASAVLSSFIPKSGTQSVNPESSIPPTSQQGLSSASRQMTIFYGGQAHVFDEVHPNTADAIMALARSSGGASWSTTYALRSSARPSLEDDFMPNVERGKGISSLPPPPPKELRGKVPIFFGNSSHGISQGGVSTALHGSSNSSFGDRGGMTVRYTRPTSQVSETNSEGKKRED